MARAHAFRIGYLLVLLLVAALTVGLLVVLDTASRSRDATPRQGLGVVALDETVVDPAVWGRDYPAEYEAYLRTVDTERTRHGGSEAFQKLDEDPTWRVLYAGYPFAVDYREERGHAYMLQDQRETERVTQVRQPGACLGCHASMPLAWRRLGLDAGAPGTLDLPLSDPDAQVQLRKGYEAMCAMSYEDAARRVDHPVACIDCHDPKTHRLRVTRPAFLEGIAALADGTALVPHLESVNAWRRSERAAPYDPNRDATRREMRALVCAQCHVEYAICGDARLVVYPWRDGLRADEEEDAWDEADHTDWTHLFSRAPLLKAQHPEFEMWSQGIHARAGVACADCHMPPKRDGGTVFTDHHVRSPLLNAKNACCRCHDAEAAELVARANAIQDTTQELMLRAEDACVALVRALEAGAKAALDEQVLEDARRLHRTAQWRLDFVASENSTGFHAPQEAARLLGEAIDLARQGQILLLAGRLDAKSD